MKARIILTIPMMVVLVVACTNELNNTVIDYDSKPSHIDELLTIVARSGDTSDTKTAIQPDGTSIYWTEGDAINLFYGSSSSGEFTTAITEPSEVAEFTGNLTGSVQGANAYWAVYPFNAANTCDGDGVTLTIPSAQTTVPGTFADKLNPAVATSPGLDLAFYNVGSWFIFSVSQDGITSAVFEGNNNEDIAGTVRVTMDDSSRPVSSVQNGIKRITITPAGGGAFTVGEDYYIVLRPQTLSNGYTLTLKKGAELKAKCTVSKTASFARSQARRKRNADNGLTFMADYVDLGLSVKWSKYNLSDNGLVGSQESYGEYYAWGETETKDRMDFNQSTYSLNSGTSITKYNTNSYGFVDKKTILEPGDDAAAVILGDNWRMPTEAEWTELLQQCTWTWTSINLVNGYKITSKKTGYTDQWIFLPAAGYRVELDANSSLTGNYGFYWSSSLDSNYPNDARSLQIDTYSHGVSYNCRYYGLTIRPVLDDTWESVTGLSLNKNTLCLSENNTETLSAIVLPQTANNKRVTWVSSDSAIVTVVSSGLAAGTVTAIAPGSATITATTEDGGFSSSCTVTVFPSVPNEMVDLGLSVKWASCNIGASVPEEHGNRFAWGETNTKYNHNWSTYKWCSGSYDSLTKYNTNDSYGTVDNVTELIQGQGGDDAAAVTLGGDWRMPTSADWEELCNNCTGSWTTYNGVFGNLVTSSKNGNSIFLPASGSKTDTSVSNLESAGNYWSSSLYTGTPNYYDGPHKAWYMHFHNSTLSLQYIDRYYGYSVRPVCD